MTAAFDGRFDGIGKEDKTRLIYSSNNISSKQKTKKEEQKSLIIRYRFSVIGFANEPPPSLLALNSGISTPVLLVHDVTYTLLPDAAIFVFRSTTCPLLGELVIALSSVSATSVLFAKNTFQCPVSLFVHAMKTVLFPVGSDRNPRSSATNKRRRSMGWRYEERHLPI